MLARSRNLLTLAAVLLFAATALGAFGAHVMRDRLPDAAFRSYETAVFYHFFHALGLLGIGLYARDRDSGWLRAASALLIAGIALFSGSLYAIAFGAPRWLGAVTPLGGAALMAAWLCFAIAARR
ncbi:MAG: DUF423 domain-containing protein [Steroidobacteraceae bacterium]|nr:DUF423 domain-containing protein [Steroidobacteraceae bacterium]MDW8258893.1 DUF423 domain-containing protein [Gammaproteobacteria bacterium]